MFKSPFMYIIFMDEKINFGKVILKIKKGKHFLLKIDKRLFYRPGQYIDIYEINERKKILDKRAFTLAQKTNEYETEIYISQVDKGKFSNMLSKLEVGDTIYFSDPEGLCIHQRTNKNKIIMIALGSGISTYRSYIYNHIDNKDLEFNLFYANKHEEDFFFKQDFLELEEYKNNFKFYPVVTEEKNLFKEMDLFLSKYKNLEEYDILVSGPMKANQKIIEFLENKKIKAENILID